MAIHLRGASAWGGEARELHLKSGGAYQEVDEAYTKVNGVWRMFHTAEVQVLCPLGSDARTAADVVNAAEPGLWSSSKRKRLILQGGERDTLRIPTNFGGEFVFEIRPTGILSGGRNIEGLAIDDAGTGKLVPVLNNGIIRGRGGNGGVGGQGGPGFYDYQLREPASGWAYDRSANANSRYWYVWRSWSYIWWGRSPAEGANVQGADTVSSIVAPDGWTYFRGNHREINNGMYYDIARQRTDRAYTGGGSGGPGGVGIGYNIARTNGQDGNFGGQNAGRGGRGGDGGNWGANGGTGATGASGNNGVGAAGAAGTASFAIWGNNRIIYSGNGSVIGARNNN